MYQSTTAIRLRSRLKMRQLATLVAVADAGSLRRAATTLAVTQPSLSKVLRELESSVGRSLFVRTRQGLVPTRHGVVTIEEARRVLRDVDALAETLHAVDQGAEGRLRLGVIPYVSSDWLRGVISRLVQAEPPVFLQVTEAATDGLLEALRARRLDCVVGRITAGNSGVDLAWRPVFEQSLRVVARAKHPLLRRGRRPMLAHLADQEWILPPVGTPTRHLVEHLFNAAGLPAPQTRLETYSLPVIESFVAHGDALAAVPDDIARQLERRGEIRPLPFRWAMPPICLAWLAGHEPSPIIRRFEQAALAVRSDRS